jgi:lipopolysaccharide biosynthesis glycosyltransferase
LLWNIDRGVQPHFYLRLDGFGSRDLEMLRQTLDRAGKPYQVTLLPAPDLDFSGLPSLHGNLMTYTKLVLARMVGAERVLYIDSDTIVNLDVSELLDWPMRGKPLAAHLSGRTETVLDGKARMRHGIPGDSPAFNAGVLLIDIARWNELGLTEDCLAFGRRYAADLISHDQTILNIKLYNNVQHIPNKFNTMPEASDGIKCLTHFVSSPKPWDLFGEWIHPQAHIYQSALASTALRFEEQKKYFRFSAWLRARGIFRSYGRTVLHQLRSARVSSHAVIKGGHVNG